MKGTLGILFLAAWFGITAAGAGEKATEYHVGPGQKFTKVGDVPWEQLLPGDAVFIHWRSAEQGGDYREKINLTRSGEKGKPIRLVGVKGPNGERPCLNGKDAVTRTVDPDGNSTHFPGNQQRGVLCFSSRGHTPDDTPGADYWEVSGLKITGARPANDFVDSFGKKSDFQRAQGGLGSAGAGVFIDRGNNLRFSDLELSDNNNGFFGSSDNYGSLVKDSGGSHIKDRGANTVIEGNFFDGTAVPLFLDPPEYSEGWMDKQPGFERLTFRNNVLRKDGNLPVNAMDLIAVGFGIYGKFTTVRTVDISHNTFVISATQRENWSFNILDLMAKPQVIKWDDNVFLRYVDAKDAAPAGIVFVAKIDPVDDKTIIEIGPHNFISAQESLQQQKEGNGQATIKGWDNLTKLPAMSRAELEKKFGINLHDQASADFARFNAETNAWYKEHPAGATMTPGTKTMPVPGEGSRPAAPKPAAE